MSGLSSQLLRHLLWCLEEQHWSGRNARLGGTKGDAGDLVGRVSASEGVGATPRAALLSHVSRLDEHPLNGVVRRFSTTFRR